MTDVIRWYLVVQLIGLAALPLAARAFRGLPDRGYAFARPVGLLAVSVALWLGCIFGFWSNSGAMVAVLTVALAAAGWLGLRSTVDDLRSLWQNRRSHIYVVEGLFLVAFLFWAYCRAHFSAIEATEKPMELAFLNGILRSSRFPPADPWLAGNSISYYYLGYVIIAAVTELSGVVPAVAFNLAIALLFALTVTGAFALGHALVEGLRATRLVSRGEAGGSTMPQPAWPSWLGGGLAAVFVTLLGNLEGFFELLHAHGVGTPAFWQSLAIWHLNNPIVSQQWYPTDAEDNWWWFRATRVILDYPAGAAPPDGYNTITEFPVFSFLLGDLHPHVIALPFAFVCLGYALSFLRAGGEVQLGQWRRQAFDLGFIAFLFGAMFLLNAWDILTYLFVLICAYGVRAYLARPSFDLRWLRTTALFGVVMLVGALLAYWPFYLTFQSQASGLLGMVTLRSHLSYFVLFWGPFLFLAGSLLIAELVFGLSPLPVRVTRTGPAWTRHPMVWVAVAIVAVGCWFAQAPALTLLIPMLVAALALLVRYLAGTAAGEVLPRPGQVPVDVDRELVESEVTGRPLEIAGGAVAASWASEHVFVFILIFVGVLLVGGTEVVFIKDSFDNRMNTVFKLYFQAWELFALAGAYTVYYLGSGAFRRRSSRETLDRARSPATVVAKDLRQYPPRWAAAAWVVVATALLAGAFVYVPAAIEARSNGFSNPATLNGLLYFEQYQPDDAAGIAWLNQHVSGTATIVEATGGSYSAFDEVAWMTGLPTILGWDFHEIQWHGASIIPQEDQRKNDINTIYQTTDVKVALGLLQKYHVQYVYVGPQEQQVYGKNPTGLAKFGQFMDPVFHNNGVTIYRSRGSS
jgi:YYY domain-containing protein